MPLLLVFLVAGAVLTTRRRMFGVPGNPIEIMHSNLRILYVLVALTAVTAAVWWFQGGEGDIAKIDGVDFAVVDTSLVDKIFIADMAGKHVMPKKADCGM